MKKKFEELGYHIERTLFSKSECRGILKGIRSEEHRAPLIWEKGCAVSIPSWAALARNDRLVDKVSELLGENIVLWGASLIVRIPNQVHHWHNDLESAGGSGFVSIWMGLRKTDPDTSIKVIPGSHHFPKLLYQFAAEEGIRQADIEDEHVLEWSQVHQSGSHIENLDTTNGDALFFDGRLWHGSVNRSNFKKRIAVLLQYARAEKPVRIPQFGHKRWPMEYFKTPKPPCLIVRGSSPENTNNIMPGPTANPIASKKSITTLIETFRVRADEPGERVKKSFPLLNGPTPDLRMMECHYSSLGPGQSTHPPHIHDEEEIQMVIQGQAEMIVEDAKGSNQLIHHPVKQGDFVYLPGNWRHTYKNTSDKPVVCLIFKWLTDEYHSEDSMDFTLVKGSEALAVEPGEIIDAKYNLLLEGKTDYLRKLQSHITRLQPGRGYAAHVDSYDVGIVLYEGQVETLGETVDAPAFIFYAAGEKHGMKNTSNTFAKHIAFEFHGKHGDIYESPRFRRRRKLKESLTNPGLVIKHLKWVIKNKLFKSAPK